MNVMSEAARSASTVEAWRLEEQMLHAMQLQDYDKLEHLAIVNDGHSRNVASML